MSADIIVKDLGKITKAFDLGEISKFDAMSITLSRSEEEIRQWYEKYPQCFSSVSENAVSFSVLKKVFEVRHKENGISVERLVLSLLAGFGIYPLLIGAGNRLPPPWGPGIRAIKDGYCVFSEDTFLEFRRDEEEFIVFFSEIIEPVGGNFTILVARSKLDEVSPLPDFLR